MQSGFFEPFKGAWPDHVHTGFAEEVNFAEQVFARKRFIELFAVAFLQWENTVVEAEMINS